MPNTEKLFCLAIKFSIYGLLFFLFYGARTKSHWAIAMFHFLNKITLTNKDHIGQMESISIYLAIIIFRPNNPNLFCLFFFQQF